MATATEKKSNYFAELNAVNVSDKIKKKNGLNYLSWAWAWSELKKRYPMSYYTIYEDANGMNYFSDGHTAWVKTSVTVVLEDDREITHTEYLPIMNLRNQSIPVENVTSMDVNKAIQRSLTKACARHGIGLYLYQAEDLPEDEAEAKAALGEAKGKIVEICKALAEKGKREDAVNLIAQYNYGNKNPNSITDKAIADVVLEKLSEMVKEG